eukprot:TRINITY_DN3990_c1_g1_i3.p3 TRINITY_DN3990_c1_g1~~TRINITY_DN3990_c1_g1_i3.p3  ORF type:complete len:147 (-),score=36.94 TRINITY_DN3990_c1_g1_i3:653-1093(-)
MVLMLKIRYENDRYLPYDLELDDFIRVQDGHGTQNWASHSSGFCGCFGGGDIPDEALCFSLIFTNETVDIACLTVRAKNAYFEAFSGYANSTKNKGHHLMVEGSKSLEENRRKQARAQREQRREDIKKKYDRRRQEARKKYGTFEQ